MFLESKLVMLTIDSISWHMKFSSIIH